MTATSRAAVSCGSAHSQQPRRTPSASTSASTARQPTSKRPSVSRTSGECTDSPHASTHSRQESWSAHSDCARYAASRSGGSSKRREIASSDARSSRAAAAKASATTSSLDPKW
jgi:hypothetical protein